MHLIKGMATCLYAS